MAALSALVVLETLGIVLVLVIAKECIEDENASRAEADRLRRRLQGYEQIDDVTEATRSAIRRFR